MIVGMRGKRVTSDFPLHRACRRRDFRALRERRISIRSTLSYV
ncbi:hypothetical protein [uncultured Selenomonas sp.]|nr:hypothetical protein [uncultured Selenomonas sp.]